MIIINERQWWWVKWMNVWIFCVVLLSAEDISYAIPDGVPLVVDHDSDASLVLCDNFDLLWRCLHVNFLVGFFFTLFSYLCVFECFLFLLLLFCVCVIFYCVFWEFKKTFFLHQYPSFLSCEIYELFLFRILKKT